MTSDTTPGDTTCCRPEADRPDTTLTVPGLYHGWPITAQAADTEWITTTTWGQVHDGDLIFGTTQATGPMRLHYHTAAEWRDAARACDRLADWLEAS